VRLTKKQIARNKKAIKKAIAIGKQSKRAKFINHQNKILKKVCSEMDRFFNSKEARALLFQDIELGRKTNQSISFRRKGSIQLP